MNRRSPVRRRILPVVGFLLLTAVHAQMEEPADILMPPPPAQTLPEVWTRAEVLPLWPDVPPGGSGFFGQQLPENWPESFVRNTAEPALHVFRPRRPDGRALLVMPGGAYRFVSVANEGIDVATALTPRGITVFVLTYRLPGEGWAQRSDVPLQDAQRAMRIIRANAERFRIDPDTTVVVGFSAGGHLAATLATQHMKNVYAAVDATDRLSAQPLGVGLIYPVVTMMRPFTHELSRTLLLGDAPNAAELRRRSAELNVDSATPPLFIVHAMDDDAVPVENSLQLASAMRTAGRPIEIHLLQEGGHAFGTGFAGTSSAEWPDLLDAWWRRLRDGARRSVCARACLIDMADRYLAALASRDPGAAPLSDSIEFVENVTAMRPGEGVWATATRVRDSYRIDVPDPVQGTIGFMTIVDRVTHEGTSPALLAARLKIENGLIVEAEHLIDEVPDAADPARLAAPRAALTATVAEAERMPRSRLAEIAGSYYEALERSDGSLAPFGADCERQENGIVTAAHYLAPAPFESIDRDGNSPPAVARDCIGQMNSRRFAYIDSIDNRRVFAVDPVQGLVMGLSHFRQSMARGPHRMVAADGSEVMWDELRDPYDLPAAHILRITDGEIHEVEAIGVFVPYNSPTGWEQMDARR
ncbi:MAG: alpha/beta hydrolase [Gammaproteobacteria bacterium]